MPSVCPQLYYNLFSLYRPLGLLSLLVAMSVCLSVCILFCNPLPLLGITQPYNLSLGMGTNKIICDGLPPYFPFFIRFRCLQNWIPWIQFIIVMFEKKENMLAKLYCSKLFCKGVPEGSGSWKYKRYFLLPKEQGKLFIFSFFFFEYILVWNINTYIQFIVQPWS